MADYRKQDRAQPKDSQSLASMDAFSGEIGAAVDPVVDLVLDPEPSADFIKEVAWPGLSLSRSPNGILA